MSVRHDWYQTETYVKITVLMKNAIEKNYQCKIEPERIELTAESYNLMLDLYRPINIEKSSHKATPSKIEITLYKTVGEQWTNLQKEIEKPIEKVVPIVLGSKNWDKLAKEIEAKEEEERKGEEALSALFQKIYTDSTPEVRKAMNKSYSESAGTVLSTNWQEVGEKKVDVKPVDGTEYKKWKE